MLPSIEHRIAQELSAKPTQISATISLLDGGASVPFIARYRKEATGGLDDNQLRLLEERLDYLRELEKRRTAIISAIEKQNKMTPSLLSSITHAVDKTHLEDLYLPYRKKRRTKAQIAHESSLQPLADSLLNDPQLNPKTEAAKYLRTAFTTEAGENPGVTDTTQALEGASHILIERFAEHATLLQSLREYLRSHGVIVSKVIKDKTDSGIKFSDYFSYSETIKKIPSHRVLAILRGQREKILRVSLQLDYELKEPKRNTSYNPCESLIAKQFGIQNNNRPADQWLTDTVHAAWRTKIFPHLETELISDLREHAESEAINVFARNLKALLLASPAGPRVTIGLDPGLRTGVKICVVDATGKILDTATIYPHQPRNDWNHSLHTLKNLVEKYQVTLIAIGNGTGSRETDDLVKTLIKNNPTFKLTSIVVSEAGASVYSASQIASQELPDMDVTLRGAVSIARRLQDPLAELVKIDPKSIGVGQYQHDVAQNKLTYSLGAVVEDCVNAVGVDVNTASSALLQHVSGLSRKVAQNIVTYRDKKGIFKSRADLRKVPHFGDKTFEQAAGFLRIVHGNDPLDASAVHPESYPIVMKILADIKTGIHTLIGNTQILKSINPAQYVDAQFGLPTIQDILAELEKPGRDPRPAFTTAVFKKGVETLNDLRPNMLMEGVVTNVAAFGAFVDIGVHQDGLVHISALADKFVKDPNLIVKVGQVVNVKVLEIDEKRKRISLTMRLTDTASSKEKNHSKPKPANHSKTKQPNKTATITETGCNAMATAFANLRKQN